MPSVTAVIASLIIAGCGGDNGNQSAPLPIQSAMTCAQLNGMTIPAASTGLPTTGATVTSTQVVPATGTGAAAVGEYCKVLGDIDPATATLNGAPVRCAGGVDTGHTCLSDAQIAAFNATNTPLVLNLQPHPQRHGRGQGGRLRALLRNSRPRPCGKPRIQCNAAWDSVAALENWVEKGIAPPLRIVADTAGVPGRTHPLCAYPNWPKYKGSGDINSAQSYTCATQ